MRIGGIFFLVLLLLGACSKPYNFRSESAETIKMDALPTDFKIPAKIWEIVEKTPDDPPGTDASSRGVSYSSVRVFLTEKNEGILKSSSFVIDFPRGGGSLDLSRYVSSQPGSFFLGFELPEEFQTGANFRALYISQARKRKIDGRVFGGGCSHFFDITGKFSEMMKTEGIKANTTRQRHVTVLAGHYIFSVVKDNRVFITQVTLTDEKNKNLLCGAL